jgi:hypothetical protein
MHIGFTIAERLFLALVAGSALFAVASLFSVAMASFKRIPTSKEWVTVIINNLGLILDGLAIIIFLIFWLIPILSIPVIPLLVTFLVTFGVLYGLIFRIVISRTVTKSKRIQREMV